MTPTRGGSSTSACTSGVEDTRGPGRFAWAEGQGGGGTTGLSGGLDGTIASLLVCIGSASRSALFVRERREPPLGGPLLRLAGLRQPGEVVRAKGPDGRVPTVKLSWPLASEDCEHQRRRASSGERFPGPHRALPQGVGAAPVYSPGESESLAWVTREEMLSLPLHPGFAESLRT